jgi:adenosylhomocysteine nucleosidase
MILIVTALMLEAAPVIDYFKLKKDVSILPYPVYRGSDIALIVSGVGKVRSAMAAVYLNSIYNAGRSNVLVNLGLCGAGSSRYKPGSLLVVNKVTDVDTGWDYYPDVFIGGGLSQVALHCCSKPVKTEDVAPDTDFFCDMESSGVMEAAKKFSYSHNVLILKIISDFLAPDRLDKKQLKGYIEKSMPVFESILQEMRQLNKNVGGFSHEEDHKFIDSLCTGLRFSEAMKLILLRETKKARLNRLEPLEKLKAFSGLKVNNKVEGKKVFEQIIEELRKKPV